MTKLVNGLTNALLLVTCAVTLMVMYPRAKAELFSPGPVRIGQKITIPNGPVGKETLVLAIRQGCEFCESDIPIYQKLSTARKVLDGSVSIVVVVPPNQRPDYRGRTQRWLDDNKIPGILRIAAKFPVDATPTVMLIGEDSRVRKVWIGSLKGDEDGVGARDASVLKVLQ